MWTFGSEPLEIVLRVLLVYVVVLVGIRISGKREVGQMTPIDLVLMLLIANAVQNAMTGPDTSLIGGLLAAATLLLLNWSATRLLWKNRKLRRIIEGDPTLLIYQGQVITAHLKRENVTPEDLSQALREHGIATFADVYIATLEVDGSISVLKNEERPTTAQPHHRIRFVRHH